MYTLLRNNPLPTMHEMETYFQVLNTFKVPETYLKFIFAGRFKIFYFINRHNISLTVGYVKGFVLKLMHSNKTFNYSTFGTLLYWIYYHLCVYLILKLQFLFCQSVIILIELEYLIFSMYNHMYFTTLETKLNKYHSGKPVPLHRLPTHSGGIPHVHGGVGQIWQEGRCIHGGLRSGRWLLQGKDLIVSHT